MAQILTNHTYEEIRQVVLDVLARRVEVDPEPTNYDFLTRNVGGVLALRDRFEGNVSNAGYLSAPDKERLQEIFWDLFRQGIVTLGMIEGAQPLPIRVSEYGRKILANPDLYFYYDVSSYEKTVRDAVPGIAVETLTYLKEAMQAFMAGCFLSSSVMVGVAAEDAFETILETIEIKPTHKAAYKKVFSEIRFGKRVEIFRDLLLQNKKSLDWELAEDIDARLFGILSTIRGFRNTSGHPTGKIPSRYDCYVIMHLFIPCCKKIYGLIEHFKK